MFKNVGKKIQGVVQLIFLVQVIMSIIAGIGIGGAMAAIDAPTPIVIIVALAVIFGGIITAWVSELAIFAYGKIAECQETQVELLKAIAGQQGVPASMINPRVCVKCGAPLDNDSVFCQNCGQPR